MKFSISHVLLIDFLMKQVLNTSEIIFGCLENYNKFINVKNSCNMTESLEQTVKILDVWYFISEHLSSSFTTNDTYFRNISLYLFYYVAKETSRIRLHCNKIILLK